MEQGLFRSAALAARRRRPFGPMLVATAPSAGTYAYFALLSAVAVLAFAMRCDISRRVTVHGYLAPTSGVARLAAPMPAHATEVVVPLGAAVVPGQAIVTLVAERGTDDGDLDAQLARSYETRRRELRGRIEVERGAATADAAAAEARIRSLRDRSVIEHDRLAAERDREHATRQRLDDARTIAALGLLPRERVRALEDDALARRIAVDAASRSIAELEQARSDAERSRDSTADAHREKLATLTGDLAALEREHATDESARRVVLRAPIAGRLTGPGVAVGEAVSVGQTLFAIAPSGSGFEARLLVPARASGFLRRDQPVRLRYDAFPYQQFGAIDGRVSEVATVALVPGERFGPLVADQPEFPVEVAVPVASVRAYGRDWPLRTGMTLVADLTYARQSILGRVLDPLRRLNEGD